MWRRSLESQAVMSYVLSPERRVTGLNVPTHTHTLSVTLSLCLSLSRYLNRSHSHTLSLSVTLSLSLSLSRYLNLSHSLTHALSLSLFLSFPLSLFLSHTHRYIYIHIRLLLLALTKHFYLKVGKGTIHNHVLGTRLLTQVCSDKVETILIDDVLVFANF